MNGVNKYKKVYFDTEFSGLHKDTELMSIGFKSECGAVLYAELNDYDESKCDDWIKENVIKNLRFNRTPVYTSKSLQGKEVMLKCSMTELKVHLELWFQDLLRYDTPTPKGSVTAPSILLISDCLAYDFVLFNHIWGHAFNIPKCVYYIPMDICTLFFVKGIDPDVGREEFSGLQDSKEQQKHNSLWDAKVIKACYDKLVSLPYSLEV